MMKASELKQKSTEELKDAILSAEVSLRNLRFAHTVTPIENPNRIKHAKKDIARMKTELHVRVLAEVKEKVDAKELTLENASEYLQKNKFSGSVNVAKVKKIIGNSVK